MRSLQGRLLLIAALVLIAFVVFTGWALERAFVEGAQQAEHDKLQGLVYTLLGAADISLQRGLQVRQNELPEKSLLRPDSGLYLTVLDDRGELLWKSPSLLFELPDWGLPEVGEWRFQQVETAEGGDLFVLSFGVNWAGEGKRSEHYTFMALEGEETFRRQLHVFQRTLFIWLVVSALLLLIVLLLVLRWGLRPVSRLKLELEAIEAGTKERMTGSYPEELDPLIVGLNTLLRHERKRQRRYRNALDDLAHSLKTPLAVLRGVAEEKVVSKNLPQRLSEQVNRMGQIVDYQLHKAATAGGHPLERPIPLAPLAQKVVMALAKVYHHKDINYRIDVPESLGIRVEHGDLMELLGNLLDNAAKWCVQRVALSAVQDGNNARLQVDDDGPGFPQDNIDSFLRRGVRADTRTEGQGIGLSVVAEIIKAYEGEIHLERSPWGGARVIFTLPSS